MTTSDQRRTPSRRILRIAKDVVARMDTRRRFADHMLTDAVLWNIMRTCAAPSVARAIRKIK